MAEFGGKGDHWKNLSYLIAAAWHPCCEDPSGCRCLIGDKMDDICLIQIVRDFLLSFFGSLGAIYFVYL